MNPLTKYLGYKTTDSQTCKLINVKAELNSGDSTNRNIFICFAYIDTMPKEYYLYSTKQNYVASTNYLK